MKRIFFILCVCSMFVGCFEDDGNYSYKELNEITESAMEWTYLLREGDGLHIEPKLHFKYDSVNVNLKHEWILPDTIIEGAVLDLDVYPGPIGYRRCYYRVTDLDIDLPYIFQFNVELTAKYQSGWLLLTENNGMSELAMIWENHRLSEEGEILETTYTEEFDIYKNVNGDELGSEPVKLVEHFPTTQSGPNAEVWVLQNGGQGTVLLNGESLKRESYLYQEFIGDQLPDNFRIKDAVFYSHMHYVLSEDNKMYSRKTEIEDAFHAGRFDPEPVGGVRYDVPLIIPTGFYEFDGGMFYERNTNQYMFIEDERWYTDGNGEILPITYNDWPDGFTPLNDLGDKQIVYSNFKNGGYWEPTYFYSILYDESEQKYYRQYFELDYSWGTFTINPFYEQEFPGNELTEESVMAVSRMSSFFFFSGGVNQDKLYWISTEETAEAPRLYFDFNGDRITTISIAVNAEEGERMGVGTESGRFYIFDVASSTLASGTPKILYQMESSVGKVVDVIFKVCDPSSFWNGYEGR